MFLDIAKFVDQPWNHESSASRWSIVLILPSFLATGLVTVDEKDTIAATVQRRSRLTDSNVRNVNLIVREKRRVVLEE
jgi:hypothetical protein